MHITETTHAQFRSIEILFKHFMLSMERVQIEMCRAISAIEMTSSFSWPIIFTDAMNSIRMN